LNWLNRYAVRIGSALALAVIALSVSPERAAAADSTSYVFQGQRITLSFENQGAGRAIAIDDPGLHALFAAIGATVTWQKGQRYILVTTGEPLVISFALGDTRYDVGPVSENASFAPFLLEGHAYVPFDELVRALGLAQKNDILQPQLTTIAIQSAVNGTKLIARGGMPLDGSITSEGGQKLTITFDGVGTALPPSRTLAGGPVQRIDVRTDGPPAHPRTLVTLLLAAGTRHTGAGTDDQRDFTIGFDGAAVAQAAAPPAAQPAAEPSEPASAPAQLPQQSSGGAATVGIVQAQGDDHTANVRIAVSGNADYEWHRLRPPDNRFWIDVHGAKLSGGPSDMPGAGVITAVRVRQQSPDTVRVALSLSGFQSLTVTPDQSGISIVATDAQADVASAMRAGSGTIGSAAAANAGVAANAPWKFGQRTAPAPIVSGNGRLIVIDPGHGGSDWGSIRGDFVEKTLTLDMSKRLRDILVARGWQVVMTRDSDRDVYGPNDSDHDELQARDDIANNNGARLFVSIHVNAYINSGPHGATVYYYKPVDLSLAQAVERRIAEEGGIKDDGTVKDKLYVVHHATMPATLVETAFISNPDDRQLLQDPQWRQRMARAIADGIGDYAGPPPANSSGGGR
jgi:N-acetylmuramoyl-L-alanine amidase